MVQVAPRQTALSSWILPATAVALALAIFAVDTILPLGMAVAVLYVVVVMSSAEFLPLRGIWFAALGCGGLAVLSYLIEHGATLSGIPFVRLVVSLAAIAITGFLAAKGQKTAAKLQEAERELRLTIDMIPALVISVSPDGSADFVNARWRELGFSEQDMRSLSIVHPDDLPEFSRVRARSLATGAPYQVEIRLGRDGVYRWYLVHTVPLRAETGAVIRRYTTATDIEDRKRAEDALRHSEALLAETQRLSHTGSVGLDVATGEVFWSAEGARIFGYDPSVAPTLDHLVRRVHPDDAWLARRSIGRAYEGETDTEFELRLVMPDGAVKYVKAVSPGTRDASDPRVVRAVIDVTAARAAELALREAQRELAHVTRVTTLGEFTASIAHEVNQPLAAVVTNGEVSLRLLERTEPDLAEVREAVRDIIGSGRRASEIIRRIRALSTKAETPKVALDINDVIEEIVPLVQSEVQSHQASLRVDLAPGLVPVQGDRVQLQQVLINLIVNGMEAMAPVTGRPPRAGDNLAARRYRRGAGRGPGLGSRHRSRERQTAFQRLLHHQAQGHGHGIIDLPHDHREPRRPPMGFPERRARRDIPVRLAPASRQ